MSGNRKRKASPIRSSGKEAKLETCDSSDGALDESFRNGAVDEPSSSVDGQMYKAELGNSVYVTVSRFRGQIYIHIRKWEQTENEAFPTKKGVALSPMRWKALKIALTAIEEQVGALDGEEDVEFKHHLGGNWNVSVTKGYNCVDFN